MCYEDEEEYDHYEQHDPLHSEAHTNNYRLREDADSSANRIVVKYPLPIDSVMEYGVEDKDSPFYGVDWQRTYYRFKFREEKSEYRNVYFVDEEGYLYFARNGNNCDKETPEEADKEDGFYKVNDHEQFRSFRKRTDDEEDDLYTGCITMNRYFMCDKEQGTRDIRIEFDLTFKDGKVINIQQKTWNICNIARHKIKQKDEEWKQRIESDKYKQIDKYWWTPLDKTQEKVCRAIEKTSLFFQGNFHKFISSIKFDKWRHPE